MEPLIKKNLLNSGKISTGAGIVIIIIVIVFIGIVNSDSGSSTVSYIPPTTSSVNVGQQGYLKTKSGGDVLVLDSENALDHYVKAAVAGDTDGMTQIFLASGFFVPENTKVLVIDSGNFHRKLRILEGDHSGSAGWVPMEFVSSSL